MSRSLNDTFTSGSYAYGDAFEHLVIAEFYRLNEYFNCDYRLSHFRTKEGDEIDLVLSRARKTFLVEIKSTDKVRADDVKKLNSLSSGFKGAECFLLSQDPVPTVIEGVNCFPWTQGIQKILELKV